MACDYRDAPLRIKNLGYSTVTELAMKAWKRIKTTATSEMNGEHELHPTKIDTQTP